MATAKRVVVFLPTYNEAQNVRLLFREIRGLLPDATILFVDDNSPDGTGSILDEIATEDLTTKVIHRPAKMGIGSAHIDAINWAYDHSFHILITMDCDMAHSPAYIMPFLEADQRFALVTGSRFKSDNSLNEWNFYRKLLTHLGHLLTRLLLGMPFDATGAFRRYDLTQLPRAFLDKVSSKGYSFFFESLHVLHVNGFAVFEIPIKLPARTYGTSKMRLSDVFRGFGDLLKQWFKGRFHKSRIIISDQQENSPSVWDGYWDSKRHRGSNWLYDKIAEFYRCFLIKPCLEHFLRKYFAGGANILHAGCGGGAVDASAIKDFDIIACDFSDRALEVYRDNNPTGAKLVKANLLNLNIEGAPFDGIYNLGVMEHFSWLEIDVILANFRQALKPSGVLVIFWPPEFGLSVKVLGAAHFLLNDILGKNIQLHPPEPSKIRSQKQIDELLRRHGFMLEEFYFGPRDMFTHAIVIARRT